MSSVVSQLCRTVRPEASLSDEQLLQDFISRKDPAAFECLVWRHGPAVLGACRRILGNEADADDAFQATFLVFLRKAKTLRPRLAIGAWLYGVACNVARKERENAARRRAKESAAAQRPVPELPDPDLKPAIDFEVERLPEKYRVPVVLCELEGQPIADTAQQLGWPQGTVASRLARGRDLLARRLARHGLSIATLATASLTTELVARVVKQSTLAGTKAGQLAEGALRGMFIAKLKLASAFVVCMGVVLFGGLTLRSLYGETEKPEEKEPPKQEKPISDEPPKKAELQKPQANTFLGRWRMLGESDYRTLEFRQQPGEGLLIAEMKNHAANWFSWKIDGEKPGNIDVSARVPGFSVPNKGIYKFEQGRLVIFLGAPLQFQGDPGKHARPEEFEADVKIGDRMIVLEREQVAWGKVDINGLQFGLLAEPHGRKDFPLGTWVPFAVLVRNTTNKAVDVDLPMMDGNPNAWQVSIADSKGVLFPITQTIAIPGIGKPATRMKTRLLDYGVAEVGSLTIGLLPRQGVLGIYPPPYALLSPGEHSFRFSMRTEKDRTISTGELKLTMERAIGWGPKVNGLEFGLALGKGQSDKIHIGERARFRIMARNSSDKMISVKHSPTNYFPEDPQPTIADGKGKSLKFEPPKIIKQGGFLEATPIKSGETLQVGSEFDLAFLPFDTESQHYVLAKLGQWKISFPKLDHWLDDRTGYGTGELQIEIVPGDVTHTDSQRIAWGPVVEGVQFGLRSARRAVDRKVPDEGDTDATISGTLRSSARPEFTIGDSVKFAVIARNMSDKETAFKFPTLSGWWPNNGRPNVRDADGTEVKPHLAVPQGAIGPQAVTQHTLKVGELAEITSVSWPFVAPAEALTEDRDYIVLAKPGTYTFQYPDLHARVKPAWPTGSVVLKFSARQEPPAMSWGKENGGLQFGLFVGSSFRRSSSILVSTRFNMPTWGRTGRRQPSMSRVP